MKSSFLAFAPVAFLAAALSASVGANNGAEQEPGHHHAPYKYVAIDVPGSRLTSAMGINDAGDVVGTFAHTQLPGQFSFSDAFLLRHGELTTIEFPHAPGEKPDTTEAAWDINNAGTVVGVIRQGHGMLEGFKYDNGNFDIISSPEFEVHGAFGINDHGTIVGNFFFPRESLSGTYFLRQGVFTRFSVPGATDTRVYGINNAEEVVGQYVDAQAVRRSFFSRGALIEDITRNGEEVLAYDLNDRGEVVGTISTEEGQRGFVLRHGKYKLIHFPGATATQAFGINNHGVIVGEYRDASGTTHGFKAISKHKKQHGEKADHGAKEPGNNFDRELLKLPF